MENVIDVLREREDIDIEKMDVIENTYLLKIPAAKKEHLLTVYRPRFEPEDTELKPRTLEVNVFDSEDIDYLAGVKLEYIGDKIARVYGLDFDNSGLSMRFKKLVCSRKDVDKFIKGIMIYDTAIEAGELDKFLEGFHDQFKKKADVYIDSLVGDN